MACAEEELTQLPKAAVNRMAHLWRITKGLSSGGSFSALAAGADGAATVAQLRRGIGTRGRAPARARALTRRDSIATSQSHRQTFLDPGANTRTKYVSK